MRWMEHVARMRAIRNGHKILFGIPEGKRPLGWRKCKWENYIRMHIK